MLLRAKPSQTIFFTSRHKTPTSSLQVPDGKSSIAKPYERPSKVKKGKASAKVSGSELCLASSTDCDTAESRNQEDDPKSDVDAAAAKPAFAVVAEPTIEAVRQALLKPKEVTVPIIVSSDYLARICKPQKELVATLKISRAHPDGIRAVSVFPQDVTEAGRKLCHADEDRLVELEKTMTRFRHVIIKYNHQSSSADERASLVSQIGDVVKEYKETLFRIIMDNANSSSTPPSDSSATGSEKPKRFIVRPTEIIKSSPSLHITPTERAVSLTVFDTASPGSDKPPTGPGYPAVLWYTNEDGSYPKYRPYSLSGLTDNLLFELLGQSFLRPGKLKYHTHSGVSFDGFIANVFITDIKRKGDLLSKRKMHLIRSAYSLPEHRPEFVLDMVKLIRENRDARKMYYRTEVTRYHDEETDEMRSTQGDLI